MKTVSLIQSLSAREIRERYKNSLLGVLWALLTPLSMLALYAFVFVYIFDARWPALQAGGSKIEFVLILFSGITTHQIVAEILSRAPTIVTSNKSYVTKIVFPLWILVPVSALSALFNGLVSFCALLLCVIVTGVEFQWTTIFLPLIILPLLVMSAGIAWFLAALGVYIRDVGQVLPPLITGMLFLAPIFFPRTALPEQIERWIVLNPVTIPVEQVHRVVFYGELPLVSDLGIYSLIACMVAVVGYLFFRLAKRGFADVL